MISHCVSPLSGLKVDLLDLFAQTMGALIPAGLKVLLKFAPSPSRGAYGSLMRDSSGRLVVYVEPSMSLDSIYQVFLHEAAHIRLHAAEIPKSNVATLPANSFDNQARRSDQNYQRVEDEAHQLQAEWTAYAEGNAWRVCYENQRYTGMDPIVSKLMILQTYYSQERTTK